MPGGSNNTCGSFASAGPLPAAAPALLYAIFFSVLAAHVAPNHAMFTRRFARRHRLAGLAYLSWLLAGLVEAGLPPLEALIEALQDNAPSSPCYQLPPLWYAVYDVVLGSLGVVLTLTAASDFSFHKRVVNRASGALDQDATITVDEMVEHSFYQGINLAQAVFLHSMGWEVVSTHPLARAIALLLVTLPWAARGRFPVNSFSANYRGGSRPPATTVIGLMYRLKKYQYLLYKHFLLHGLNISVAISGEAIAATPPFRLYWLSLNAAYVLEFFLQTLVKKGHMAQGTMLALNQLLMGITTAPALGVLAGPVRPLPAAVSLALNFVHRGHELANVAAASSAALCATFIFS